MAMTRRRYVTPEGFGREEVVSLPPAVRLTEIGLRLYADDHGRERVNQRLMLARLYPMNAEMSEQDIDEHLLRLDDAGAIAVYAVDGQTYFSVTEWPSVDRPQPSRFPAPPDPDASRSDREPIANDSWRGREREREGVSDREWAESGHARTDRESGPPSPFCPAHEASGGTDTPCRGCGRARLKRKQWDDQFHEHARVEVTFEEDT